VRGLQVPCAAAKLLFEMKILILERNTRASLLLWIQPKCFELPTPFRGSIAQSLDVDAPRQQPKASANASAPPENYGARQDLPASYITADHNRINFTGW